MCAYYRWFGYLKSFVQFIPSRTSRPTPSQPGDYQYPAGMLTEDATTPRLNWTAEMQEVSPMTWSSDNQLKYSEKELDARAAQGDRIAAEAEAQFPIGALTGEEAMKQYDKQQKAMNKQHLLLGCKGTPVFAKLSYYRCEYCQRM